MRSSEKPSYDIPKVFKMIQAGFVSGWGQRKLEKPGLLRDEDAVLYLHRQYHKPTYTQRKGEIYIDKKIWGW